MVPNQIEDELHVDGPRFVDNEDGGFLFQDVFVGSGKRFRPVPRRICLMTKFRRTGMLRHCGDDSVMLEAILLLLGIGSCALVLIAFWGLQLVRH